MELLNQKGADLLSDSARNPSRASSLEQPHAVSRSLPRPGRISESVVTGLAVFVALIGVYLFFRDLPLTGLTWDEWMDYGIARDYYENQSFLTNTDDPSQARFSHLIAAGSFALFGESYATFKLPFVAIGLGSGLGLYWFLTRMVRPVVAALAAAMYFTCPYVLAASRTGATAGDVVVMATTLGFVITLHEWLRTNRFWPYGAICGVLCGFAIGAKWTGAILLGSTVLAWLYELRRQKRRLFDGPTWSGILAQQWIAVGLAVLACPTLMLGVRFVRAALGHSLLFGGMALLQFGEYRSSSPAYYIPAVLVSKFSIVQLLVVLYELLMTVVFWLFRRKKIPRLFAVCLLSLLPMVPLATKGFQNAHYYVVTIPAVMILSALALERWLRSRRDSVRRWALWGGAATVVSQLGTSLYLAPDYLMAGRQFGTFFYSQFAGPVVNHCQGMPFAIREINRLAALPGAPNDAYILRSCLGVMQHAEERGPVKSVLSIVPRPLTPISRGHFLVLPGSYDYDNQGAEQAAVFSKYRQDFTANCRRVGEAHVDYEIWLCPPH
jgi:hypothetical protein